MDMQSRCNGISSKGVHQTVTYQVWSVQEGLGYWYLFGRQKQKGRMVGREKRAKEKYITD